MTLKLLKFSKRRALARAFELSRVFDIFRLGSARQLTIFNFHRISASNPKNKTRAQWDTSFDDTIFGPDEETFYNHIKGLKQQGEAISESDLVAFTKHGIPLPKRSFMITFDDGYRDNYELALPILNELNIPAIFFVPTKHIEDRALGWWDLIYWCLKKTKKTEITIRDVKYSVPNPVTDLAETFATMLKKKAASEVLGLVEEIRVACEVELPSREICDSQLMTWDQLRDASNRGVAIGSHTHTHRVLACLPIEEQREEFLTSKLILERELKKPVRSIAYPVGGYEHFNAETMQLSKECGYDFAFSFLTGVNGFDTIDLSDIKRLDWQHDLTTYEGVFSMPWVFGKPSCALKSPSPYAFEKVEMSKK